jgi:tetratricopeptide (TPR) repeat protein/transglutaminase-like putative cysteine protease
MMPTRKMAWIPLLLFLALAPLAQSQNPAGAAQPAPEKKAEGAQKDYSQEAIVFEQVRTSVRFEKDGTGRRELAIRARVQTDAGVQQFGQLAFGYNSVNEKLEIDYVSVLKADGSVVSAGPDSVQDLSAPIAREAPVYTDFRQKHITVPGLRPGETLEYKVAWVVHTPLAPSNFWFEDRFVAEVIVLDEQVEIDVPKDRPVKLKTNPGADPVITETADRRIYRWKRANLERESDDDEDAAPKKKKKKRKPEPPDVQMTTFQSWEELGRWYGGLERERVAPNDAIRAKTNELIRGRDTEREKVEALYDYVAKNFRYVSLSFGVGRYQPHAATEVFANQYGDCKDKHTLLASMLEAAGLRAYPVLINSSRKIDPDVPSPSQFDHVISAVPLGSDLIWMDTTTEIAPFQLLSSSLRNKKALLVPRGETPRLVETPADPPFPAKQDVEIEGQVSELGKLTARARYTTRGDGELILRSAFRQTPKHQWKQLAQIVAYSDGLSGEVTEVNASDPANTQEPFWLEYQISVPNFLDWSSKKTLMNLPLPGMGLPRADADAEEDDDPIELGTPLAVHTRLKLELPAKYSLRAPVPVNVPRDYAEYKSSYKLEGNTLTAERNLAFRMRELPAARTRDYLAFVRAVRTDEGQSVSLESTAAAGTPVIPESAKAGELFQAATAAMGNENYPLSIDLLKRVLEIEPKHKTAWGTLGFAQIVLQQFPAAIESFSRQTELNPYDESAYNLMGLAYWRSQKYEEAAKAFHKQLEVSPLHKQAQANLGRMLVEWRKYDEAVPELEKAISLQPNEESLHVSLGRAYLNQKQTDKALAAFDKAVELLPEPTVWNNVAYYLSLANLRLDRARQYAESAVAAVSADLRNLHLDRLTLRDMNRVSSLAAYWDTLGWVYFQQGDTSKAEKYTNASWLLDLHGEVGDHLGQIYEKQGRKQDAIRTYALAAVAQRPVPESRGHLARLAGGESKVEPLLAKARTEFEALRTVKLGKLLKDEPEKSEADFYLTFKPGSKGAEVEGVKFIRGSEKLRPFTAELSRAAYAVSFPDPTPTKMIRRGTLTCQPRGECSFVLQTADSVTSVN